MTPFEIPDKRSTDPEDYIRKNRRGRMKQSWRIGVESRTRESPGVSFEEGLTWGSIGQILGYLFGEVDAAEQNELYEKMLEQFEIMTSIDLSS